MILGYNNRMDTTPIPTNTDPVSDDPAGQIDAAAAGVSGAGENLGRAVEDGLANAEQKLDDLIGGLDNFLNKF